MNSFTYFDIFATKGIEYLLVLSGLLYFAFFWIFLNRSSVAVYREAEEVAPAISNWFQLPLEGRYFHQGHTWAMPESGNVVRVGMDDFAQKLVGKVDAIKCFPVGSQVIQGEKAWSLLVGSTSLDMLSPVDGKIVAINENLLSSPASIGDDPYGQSWLMKVQAPRISANQKNLLSGRLAGKWMEEVRDNLLARMNYNLGTVSQDGGVPVEGIARNLDQEKWDEIVKEFFLIS